MISSSPLVTTRTSKNEAKEALTPLLGSPDVVRRPAPKARISVGAAIIRYVLPLVALVGLGFAVKHVAQTQKVAISVPPPIEPSRSPFANTVSGAGIIEAETENISIGSPTAGVVVAVKVKVGDKVRSGDELFRLDDRQMQAELVSRKASLAAAEADLERLNAQPRTLQKAVNLAQVNEALANLADAKDALQRVQQLADKHIAAEQELFTKQQSFRAATARYEKVKADYDLVVEGAWEYDKRVARAAIEQAKANLKMTETEIERLTVRALVDGDVLQVNVRPGEFVGAPANQTLAILGRIDQLHVRVDIDENDIPRFKRERPAEASLKGHPQETYKLRFVKVEPYVIPKKSLTGQNTERVDTRVLQVVYALPTNVENLHVGQQVDVNVDVGEEKRTEKTEKSS